MFLQFPGGRVGNLLFGSPPSPLLPRPCLCSRSTVFQRPPTVLPYDEWPPPPQRSTVGQRPVKVAKTLGMFRPAESLNCARIERMTPPMDCFENKVSIDRVLRSIRALFNDSGGRHAQSSPVSGPLCAARVRESGRERANLLAFLNRACRIIAGQCQVVPCAALATEIV